MDSSLFLLQRMKLFAWFRRMGRRMRSPKGLALTLIGLLFFALQFGASLFGNGGGRSPEAIEMTRRLGPVFLLAYCVMTLLFSPGDKAFAFSPAEISFLFSGPFTRRQLVMYKIGGNIGLICLSALFFTFVMRNNAPNPVSGYFGLVLTFSFLQLFAVAVTLAGAAIGAAASSLRRRVALALLAAILGGVLFSAGRDALRNFDVEAIKGLEHAPFVRAVLAPFRPFSRAITSRTALDLLKWGAASLAVNLALAGLILALDAQFLESVAASSERLYARIERMRKGGPAIPSEKNSGKPRCGLPDLPWWGGAGPILWRQMSTALRDPLRLAMSVVAAGIFAGMGIVFTHQNPYGPLQQAGAVPLAFGCIIVGLSVLFTPLYAFDFRGDFERMDGLKALPISAERLAIGQLAAPLLLTTAPQVAGLLALAVGAWPVSPAYWALVAFAAPLNAISLEVENLMFLWFPSRPLAYQAGDVQAMGRAMLLILSKLVIVVFAAGIATAVGFLAYLVTGWAGAVVAAWCVSLGFVALLIPFIAEAFRKFDVAVDTPG